MTITYGDVRAHRTVGQSEVQPAPVQILLQPGAVLSLKSAKRGTAIRCGSGQLWLTQKGDAEDHLLSAGDVFQPSHSGLLVVQALDESTVSILE